MNRSKTGCGSPPLGTIGEYASYPQVPFPSVIPPAVIHIRPLRGRQDATCKTRTLDHNM